MVSSFIEDMFKHIQRNPKDNGWLVNASPRSREFFDADYEGSRNNSHVAAFNYTYSISGKSKRQYSTERNIKIIEKLNRKGVLESKVQLTRPMGGYKTFVIVRDKPHGFSIQSLQDAIQKAHNWFYEERTKCQNDITSKNIAKTNERKKTRHSFLFGDPFLGIIVKPGK